MDEKTPTEILAGAVPAPVEQVTAPTTPSQDPVEQELAREQGRETGRTEAEKAAFSLKKTAERLRELGGNPEDILGFKANATTPTVSDDTPVTVGMLEQMQRESGQKTALDLAEEIADPRERDLTKIYLRDRIKPTGNPQEDLRFARLAVNSVKTGQIAQELARQGTPATHVSAAGAPPIRTDADVEMTPEELSYTRPPFNMSKEQILASRPK